MEITSKNKFFKLCYMGFFLIIAIYAIVAGIYLMKLLNLVEQATTMQSIFDEYSSIQKKIGMINISFFSISMILAFLIYFIWANQKPIIIANLAFTAISLFLFLHINRLFFAVESDNAFVGSFWIIAFIGIFYIAGAITVSAIGFFAIKNLKHRKNLPEQKQSKHFFGRR